MYISIIIANLYNYTIQLVCVCVYLHTFPTTFYNSSASAPPNAPKTAVVYYTHQSHVMVGPELWYSIHNFFFPILNRLFDRFIAI